MTVGQTIQLRRGPSINWAALADKLAVGEMGYDTDLKKIKIGDGDLLWSALPFIGDSATYATSSGTSSALSPGNTINGTTFTGSSPITIKASTTNSLSIGTYLSLSSGSTWDGGTSGVTLGTNATSANTVSTIVARNGSGEFSAGVITATNYKVSVGIETTDSIALDFSADAGLRTRTAAGTVAFTGTTYSIGSTITVRVYSGASARSLTFPSGWVFVGSKPTSLAATKYGILTVTSFATSEAECIASWVAQL